MAREGAGPQGAASDVGGLPAWMQAMVLDLDEDATSEEDGEEEAAAANAAEVVPATAASRLGVPAEEAPRQGSAAKEAQEPKVRQGRPLDKDLPAKANTSVPTVRDVLAAARPSWTHAELTEARSKLLKVGANSLVDLAAMAGGASDVLSKKMAEEGLAAFSAETMLALRRQLSTPEILRAIEGVKARRNAVLATHSLAGVVRHRRPNPGELIAVRTSRALDEFLAPQPAVRMLSRRTEGWPTVVVDRTIRYQTLLGFGGSFTESSADVLAQLGHRQQEQVIAACFHPDIGLGYRMGRVHINSCDFSKGNWACCPDESDESLSSFSISHYKKTIMPFIHRAASVTGEHLKIVASPWSPPGWMKDNASMRNGGSLRKDCWPVWAEHYVRFAQEFDRAGLPLWALTVQNEPNAAVSWESCCYTAEEERDFIRYFLGPALERSGSDLNLLVWDHNRDDMLARARVIYSDPEAAKHVWGVAFHWNGGPGHEHWPDKAGQLRHENVLRTHELRRDKHLVMTQARQEGAPHLEDWDLAERYAENIIKDLNNWTEAWIDWNLILDDTGGPNHKRNCCSAPLLVDLNRRKAAVQPSFYYIGHFSRHLLPDSQRILCASNRDALESVAVANPDGTIAVVVLNRTNRPIDFWLVNNKVSAPALAPEHSITTFIMLSEVN